jgi:hypothetical protein
MANENGRIFARNSDKGRGNGVFKLVGISVVKDKERVES